MEIDCPDIRQHTHSSAPFLKGFAVIESKVELDVVAVYTATKGGRRRIETLDIERVPPRQVMVCLPDLVPIPDPEPGIGFCKRDDQGRLVVTVKNQGCADAPASTTRVEFSPGGSFDLATPSIPAGVSVDLPTIEIPGVCFDPDCDFRIRVDAKEDVIESDEGNNFASGTCIG